MALVLKDRVQETTTTTGTSDFTLGGAVLSYQSFSAIGNGNVTYYTAFDPNQGDWEVGIGTYTSAGTTLSRDTVLSSSNSGSKVSFGSESKDVFVSQPAEVTATTVGGGNYTGPIHLNGTTAYQSGTINSGSNGLSLGPITISAAVSITVSSGSIWEVLA